MLVPVIKFELNGEEYVMENTVENQEKVFSHRLTRQIKFDKQFDWQEMHYPREFIEMETWVRMINADPELFAMVSELTEV